MSIEGSVQAVLAVLVAGRCYPLVAPDSPVTPYITYQVISNPALNVLSGDAGVSNRRFQVDVWADSYGAAKGLAASVTAAMASSALSNTKIGSHDQYEAEVKIYRVSMDFSVWAAS